MAYAQPGETVLREANVLGADRGWERVGHQVNDLEEAKPDSLSPNPRHDTRR